MSFHYRIEILFSYYICELLYCTCELGTTRALFLGKNSLLLLGKRGESKRVYLFLVDISVLYFAVYYLVKAMYVNFVQQLVITI